MKKNFSNAPNLVEGSGCRFIWKVIDFVFWGACSFKVSNRITLISSSNVFRRFLVSLLVVFFDNSRPLFILLCCVNLHHNFVPIFSCFLCWQSQFLFWAAFWAAQFSVLLVLRVFVCCKNLDSTFFPNSNRCMCSIWVVRCPWEIGAAYLLPLRYEVFPE